MPTHNAVTLALFCDAPMTAVIKEATCLPLTSFQAVPEFVVAAHESLPVATFIDAARGDASQCLLAVSDLAAALPYSPCIVIAPAADDGILEKVFEVGAHDALRKPIRPSELLARLQLRIRDLRRLQNTHELRVGDLLINYMTRVIQKGRHHTQLSPTAFSAL